MNKLDAAYWQQRYEKAQTGWDIGYPSPALIRFFGTLADRDLKILIPGCGNAHEAVWLHEHGFSNVFLLDIAEFPLFNFRKKHAAFPETNLLLGDFFLHDDQYDLVVEQTFFCALDPSLRPDYFQHLKAILAPKGRMAGLLFGVEFEAEGPPFGGTAEEYRKLAEPLFEVNRLEACQDSIPPRAGRELFIEITPRS